MKMSSACRICLCNTDDGVSIFQVHITELKFSEMLTSCSGVPISDEDDFPKKICQSCTLELPNVWKFVKMCRSSDEMLRETRQELCKQTNIFGLVKVEIKEEYNASPVISDLLSDSEDESIKLDNKGGAPEECHDVRNVKKSSLLNRHRRKQHSPAAELPCAECGKQFKRKSDLVVHGRTHSGERPFGCPLCPRRFAQSGTLAEHQRRHTGEKPYACAQCPRRFASRSSFWRHRRAHSGQRPFACERCGATFADPSTLKHHALVHSRERPHRCASCQHSAKSVYALRQHMLTHGDKHFVCEHCGKKFSVKSNLSTHTRKMHSQAAGHCALCRKDTSDLHAHALQHSGTAFACPVCRRTFRHKSGFSFHLNLHTNARKFKCLIDGCGKAFPKRNMLDFHTRKVHSKETAHLCPYCPKGFFRTSDLSRHVNSLHSELKFFK